MKIGKHKIGFGNRYKTINPLVLLARVVAAKFAAKDQFSSGDDSNDYWIREMASFGSSSSHLMGFPIYGADYKGEKIVDFIHGALRPIHDWKRSQYYRFKKKHHILKIRNIEPTTWTDVDTRMFNAMFTILGSFVEEELGKISEEYKKEYPDCDYKGYRLHSAGGTDEQAIDLWLWYTVELPKEEKAYADYVHRKFGKKRMISTPEGNGLSSLSFEGPDESTEEDEKKYGGVYEPIEELKDKKFRELVELRRTLWT
jgi:hypothetical protein